MKNKQIAAYSIISLAIFIISFMSAGLSIETADGFVKFMYYISLFSFYGFLIYGWIRLFKSNE